MQTQVIETARLKTHCWMAGSDTEEPLLLVHGNLTTGRFWQAVAECLSDGFQIVAPDLRAFGRTEPLPVDAARACATGATTFTRFSKR
jgi:pimeloyl-ACP methyl ester carboxylesterase